MKESVQVYLRTCSRFLSVSAPKRLLMLAALSAVLLGVGGCASYQPYGYDDGYYSHDSGYSDYSGSYYGDGYHDDSYYSGGHVGVSYGYRPDAYYYPYTNLDLFYQGGYGYAPGFSVAYSTPYLGYRLSHHSPYRHGFNHRRYRSGSYGFAGYRKGFNRSGFRGNRRHAGLRNDRRGRGRSHDRNPRYVPGFGPERFQSNGYVSESRRGRGANRDLSNRRGDRGFDNRRGLRGRDDQGSNGRGRDNPRRGDRSGNRRGDRSNGNLRDRLNPGAIRRVDRDQERRGIDRPQDNRRNLAERARLRPVERRDRTDGRSDRSSDQIARNRSQLSQIQRNNDRRVERRGNDNNRRNINRQVRQSNGGQVLRDQARRDQARRDQSNRNQGRRDQPRRDQARGNPVRRGQSGLAGNNRSNRNNRGVTNPRRSSSNNQQQNNRRQAKAPRLPVQQAPRNNNQKSNRNNSRAAPPPPPRNQNNDKRDERNQAKRGQRHRD